jgi:hypothetical protein
MFGGAVESAVSSRLCPSARLGADIDTMVVFEGNMGPGSNEDRRFCPFPSAGSGPGDRRGT